MVNKHINSVLTVWALYILICVIIHNKLLIIVLQLRIRTFNVSSCIVEKRVGFCSELSGKVDDIDIF